uniref:CDP-diacylglycerol--glycerol-3-phosphate 3-phosphatidyltransferase n=1 Tax=Globodera pallida TaxID=36090 RepID=A0A183CMQ1_GLOPA
MTNSSWFINIKDRLLCIPVQSSSVHFLHTPEQFYETLLQRIGSAKRRVVLSALYLGSDALEQRLVDCLAQAAAAPTATTDQEARLLPQHDGSSNSQRLSVSILLDFFRATRGATTAGTSSTTMLAPLTANENVEVRLFHTPKLRGILKSVLSERVNEVFGLQHMKFFVFDDTVLITGANLSDQYFVNRQDRYLLIEHCPVLADFFVDLFHVVGAHSFRLRPDGHEKNSLLAHADVLDPSTFLRRDCLIPAWLKYYVSFARRAAAVVVPAQFVLCVPNSCCTAQHLQCRLASSNRFKDPMEVRKDNVPKKPKKTEVEAVTRRKKQVYALAEFFDRPENWGKNGTLDPSDRPGRS